KIVVEVATVENNLRFPGQYYDAETGLHYNWFRYYDPETGRYLRVDPIGFFGGINPYIYCLNGPINLLDPWGLLTTGQTVFIGLVATTVSTGVSFSPWIIAAPIAGGFTAGILTLGMGGDINEAIWNGITAAYGGPLVGIGLKTGIPKIIAGGLIGDYLLDFLWAKIPPPWSNQEASSCP
ncbi:MAG: RHS repeat-associated core domain-containing protein, partial [Desulfosalsimonadaceae bacterium]